MKNLSKPITTNTSMMQKRNETYVELKFWKKGLNVQITALTLSIVMGASIILGAFALVVFYGYSKEQFLARNQEKATFISNEIEHFLSHALEVTGAIASDPSIRSFNRTTIQNDLAKLYQIGKEFDGMSIIDTKGTIIAFMPLKPGVVGMDLSERDYVKRVLSTGQSFISEPFAAQTGNTIVVIAQPVKNQQGQTIGALAGSINLIQGTRFFSFSLGNEKDSGMIVQIISKTGKIIYHPDTKMIFKDTDQISILQEIQNGKSGALTTNYNNKPFLTGYGLVKDRGWGVLVQYLANEAFQPLSNLRNVMILIIVFICLLVFAVAYLQSKAITRPLQVLMDGVKRVAEGDYSFNVDVKSQNEIGSLARSFNSMVERIREMREDILTKKEALEKANAELTVMAITDGLTKLYNHRYFQDCLSSAISIAEEEKKAVTLMMVDIDHFKYYNDLFGHQAGDKLLKELAQLLINELGPNDMVARYGGEEFTVILYDANNVRGLEAAEKIRTAVELFPFIGRHEQPTGNITVSIGVASYPENAKNKEELIKLADEALYKAKCCSRNKVELYFSVLDELKKDADQSESELINSIKMLIRIINAKDKYTYGHSERVGRYAVWIAEKLGMSNDEIKTIKMGSFLHDIGKIEISRGILMKKGSLSDDEYDIIKKHPFWGAGIIKAIESLNPTLPIIKYHHERFDGNGYPKGLKGMQIPLHARILAVADSFDAMTSNRPYRNRMSMDEAIIEMERCAGYQFDPEIVKVFLTVMEEQKEETKQTAVN
jgi:diguanylate cyclase (GGDEF)-like protein